MRRLLDKFFPIGTKRRNFLFESKKKVRKIISKMFNGLYKIIPIAKFKNIANVTGNDAFRKYNTNGKLHPKKNEYIIFDKYREEYALSHPLNNLNRKIAIHIHLYYQDLLDEFIKYLNNMPYKFDIYCSINDNHNEAMIKDKLQNIKNANKVHVKKTPNVGRDYGPMVCEFRKNLKKYDYICHIHTKKSLRTGASQDAWRIHLLDGVLGSKNLIKNIFYMFENMNVGIYFPDNDTSAPYWGNTWMGAKTLGIKYLSLLGIPFEDNYQDFSVGSMFWVKKAAAKQIFDRNWKWDEFGEECGQDDGTLAYVFERLFVLCSNYNKYNYICYNETMNLMLKNYSERNIHQYYEKNIDNLYLKLKDYDVVSFDVFDTLITRKIYNPDDVFRIIDNLISKDIKLNQSFIIIRKQAENLIRTEKNDPDINEIYNKIQEMCNLTSGEVRKIKDLEIFLEKKLLIPRKDMLKLFNLLKENGNTIILVSDMYLTSDIIKDILKQNGYIGYESIYVSCECNLRKDKGNIWDFIKEKYNGKKIIHVGDNEESDCHKLWQYNLIPEHIMSGKMMYFNSPYGYYTNYLKSDINICDSVLYGLIINKCLFNSPFKWNKSEAIYNIDSLYEYGYCIIGPILLEFMIWLIKSLKNEKNLSLLFLSREGYYFQKMYKLLSQRLDVAYLKNIQDLYFLTSRRCVSVACIENIEDIYRILDIEYYGDLKSLLKTRFNLNVKEKNFEVIIKPDGSGNKDDVLKIINKYQNEILEIARKEKKNYTKYIDKNIKNIKNATVVDLGYSGTTQMFLSKLTNQKISGKYLVVKNNPKPLALGCKVESCYNEIKNDSKHPLYKNSLLLEFFLTAPYGQLQYFDDNLKPRYLEERLVKEKQVYLDEIYRGVEELFNDVVDLVGNNIENYNFNKELIVKNFEGFLSESNYFLSHNRKVFEFEDYYCRKDIMTLEKIK